MNETIPSGAIAVGIDGSERASAALDWAIDQATLEHRALTLVHATNAHVAPHSPLDEAADRVAHRSPGLVVHHVVRAAEPEQLLTELAADAAMVVVGSHGRGPIRSRLMGSVGLALTKHAPCPVVVHRPWHPGRVRTGVLVGVDDSDRSPLVVEAAYRLASQRQLPLRVVHCLAPSMTVATGAYGWVPPATLPQPEYENAALAEVVSGMSEKYPDVHVRTEVLTGSPTAMLAGHSSRADALVLGRHHGGVATTLLLGSVTTEVVERAHCPVLVVPLD